MVSKGVKQGAVRGRYNKPEAPRAAWSEDDEAYGRGIFAASPLKDRRAKEILVDTLCIMRAILRDFRSGRPLTALEVSRVPALATKICLTLAQLQLLDRGDDGGLDADDDVEAV
jgi:hypothetical protein